MNTDVDAVVYLMLVNNLLHDVFPNCITIGGWLGGLGWLPSNIPCWDPALHEELGCRCLFTTSPAPLVLILSCR
jgi:hypothetical protein